MGLLRQLELKDGCLLLLAMSVSRKRSYACGQKWLCPLPVPHIPYFKETGKAMLANFFLTACCSRPGPQFTLCLWKEYHRPIEPSFEGSIPSTVVRWSGTTRTWRLSYVLWCHRAILIGREIWYGLNTLTILSLSLPQSIGINPPLFPEQEKEITVPAQTLVFHCHLT